MVLFEEPVDEAEASCSQDDAGAKPRKGTKRPLHLVINHAYVYEKMRNKLGPWIQQSAEDGVITVKIKELAEEFSPHMCLAVPVKNRSEPPPIQMLRFTNSVPAEVFTQQTLVGADMKPLQVELVNIESGEICSGPFSCLEVEIFVVDGDFPSNDQELRTCKALLPRNKSTMPLLVQVATTRTARKSVNCQQKFVVKLDAGTAVIRGKITDNSSWLRSGMFKLVARVMDRRCEKIWIKEALSEAFTVKESKLKERQKHEIPSPEDPTWRLINVGKKYEMILQKLGIHTVQDFLNKLESDPDKLKRELGMQSAKWESTVEHARKCQISKENLNSFNFEGHGMDDLVFSSPDFQPRNMEDTNSIQMRTGEQMIPNSNIASSDQMEITPTNISNNGNDGPIHAVHETFEVGEYSTMHSNFSRLESRQWTNDFCYPEFDELINDPAYFSTDIQAQTSP